MTDTNTASATSTAEAAPTYQWYAGGQWRDAPSVFDDFEPYTGKVYAHAPNCGPEEAKIAIKAANDAFPAWAETPPVEKARLFFKAAEIVRRRRDEIAGVLARETGSTIPFSTFQQDLVAATMEQAANWVYLPKGEVLQSNLPDTHSVGVRRPLGVVASFTPWNGANILSWRAVLNPLAAGCTVVVKPSEYAPISAGLMVAEIAEEAGFPPGVVNVVPHAPGAAAGIADEFFASDEVRVINLIGGVNTARLLAERAGRTLKRTVLELGGYNPMLILDDVDVDYAVRMATFGSFFHQGQICLNTRKIIIQRGIYDEFLEKFVARTKTLPSGDPLNPQTIIGPLVHQGAVDVMDQRISEAVSLGAKVRTGGTHEGLVYQPTILTDVPYEATAAHEETFGPLVIVEPVDTPEEAVAVANRVQYGLTSTILADDTYRAFELAPKILHGIVNVNSPTVNDEIHAPMGGVRNSGWGRTGPDSIADFTDVIWINATRSERQFPF
ncbi:aldehyde dehydrogenase family protein [Streptomyces sp. NPDC126522]|uniref:aldehyde dehydrogenase family protein n=1 Tax=Streptomyces sp. NPDC126522 TaxID=3155211 RepID=UPI0033325F96